jgi:hypothetical protein
MGYPEIDRVSGVVETAQLASEDGLRVTLRGANVDYFFSATTYSPVPDVRVGDEIQILAKAPQYVVNDKSGAQVLDGLAVESRRGTWTDSIFGDAVSTWFLHEGIRWVALGLGILAVLAGLVSLVRWIRSRPRPVASPATAPDPFVTSKGIGSLASQLSKPSQVEDAVPEADAAMSRTRELSQSSQAAGRLGGLILL